MRRLVLSVLAPILAHSWYPLLCCSGTGEGGDCHPVPCDSIVETRDGYEWQHLKFSGDQVHPSLDRDCHVCVGHYNYGTGPTDVPHCVFIQPSA